MSLGFKICLYILCVMMNKHKKGIIFHFFHTSLCFSLKTPSFYFQLLVLNSLWSQLVQFLFFSKEEYSLVSFMLSITFLYNDSHLYNTQFLFFYYSWSFFRTTIRGRIWYDIVFLWKKIQFFFFLNHIFSNTVSINHNFQYVI